MGLFLARTLAFFSMIGIALILFTLSQLIFGSARFVLEDLTVFPAMCGILGPPFLLAVHTVFFRRAESPRRPRAERNTACAALPSAAIGSVAFIALLPVFFDPPLMGRGYLLYVVIAFASAMLSIVLMRFRNG
jgi:hypothetical protein